MTTRYTKDHEWIRVEGMEAVVGITDYAQSQLGDVVFVELPPLGKKLKAHDELAVVESVKAASEVYAPAGGEVIAVNEALSGDPAAINRAAQSEGWFVKLKLSDPGELAKLMDEAAYQAFLKTI